MDLTIRNVNIASVCILVLELILTLWWYYKYNSHSKVTFHLSCCIPRSILLQWPGTQGYKRHHANKETHTRAFSILIGGIGLIPKVIKKERTGINLVRLGCQCYLIRWTPIQHSLMGTNHSTIRDGNSYHIAHNHQTNHQIQAQPRHYQT